MLLAQELKLILFTYPPQDTNIIEVLTALRKIKRQVKNTWIIILDLLKCPTNMISKSSTDLNLGLFFFLNLVLKSSDNLEIYG